MKGGIRQKFKFDPVEIEAVNAICQKFMEIQKVSGVDKHLIDVGIKSQSGKWFSKLGIKQILENNDSSRSEPLRVHLAVRRMCQEIVGSNRPVK